MNAQASHRPLASAEALRHLRLETGWTQAALAERLGRSRSYVSRLERGKTALTSTRLTPILQVLDLPPARFQRLINPPAREEVIDQLRQYFQQQPVQEVMLFGSVARNEHGPASDLDLRVQFQDTHRTTLFDLTTIKHDIEALTGFPVDLVVKESEYPHIRASLERDQIPVYG